MAERSCTYTGLVCKRRTLENGRGSFVCALLILPLILPFAAKIRFGMKKTINSVNAIMLKVDLLNISSPSFVTLRMTRKTLNRFFASIKKLLSFFVMKIN